MSNDNGLALDIVELLRLDPRKVLMIQHSDQPNELLMSFSSPAKGGYFTKIKMPTEDSRDQESERTFRLMQGILCIKSELEADIEERAAK